MTNLDKCVKKRRHLFADKGPYNQKVMVFPVTMYRCESWTLKKAEHQRIDAFELWYWRRLLRVPWTTRKSKQSILRKSILNIHWKDWCWSWSSNTLATWCEEPTHEKRLWCWERLKVGREGDYRRRDGWMASATLWSWIWIVSGDGEEQETWHAAVHGVAKGWTRLSYWTTTTSLHYIYSYFY